MHSRSSQTLAALRSEYWIPKGRSVVSAITRRCVVCQKFRGGPYKLPPMAQLPLERVAPYHAFAYVGVDFFGPLQIRRGKRIGKAYSVIFACMTTRALHLELLDDLSTGQFLLALRRFVERRGKPLQIISDNAPQFRMSKSILQYAWPKYPEDPDVRTYLCCEGIEWKFIVPYAPWMGGFYERLIGIVKCALKKMLGRLILERPQLEVMLFEVEGVVN